jgi:hypothetical protein
MLRSMRLVIEGGPATGKSRLALEVASARGETIVWCSPDPPYACADVEVVWSWPWSSEARSLCWAERPAVLVVDSAETLSWQEFISALEIARWLSGRGSLVIFTTWGGGAREALLRTFATDGTWINLGSGEAA